MSGRPFLQIPGPTLVPERIVRAMSQSIIDHRGPKFAALVGEILTGLRGVFQAERGQPILYPGSGTGGWEAAVVNTLSPGDRVLGVVNGHFSNHFCRTAAALGIEVDRLEVPYGEGVPVLRVGERLRARRDPPDPGRPGRPQRDVDGRDQRRGGRAPRARRDATSRPPPGRCRLVAGVDRLPIRRVGGGRRADRTTEGAHAPAGPHDPGRERPGDPREPRRQVPPRLLGLGPGARAEQARRVPLHARDGAPLRPPRVDRDAGGGGAVPGLPAPRAPRGGVPPRRRGPRPRHPLPRAARALEHADRRGHARGASTRTPTSSTRTARSTSPSGSGSGTSRARCSGSGTWAA